MSFINQFFDSRWSKLFAIVLLIIFSLSMINIFAKNKNKQKAEITGNESSAYFAGGCFWCLESDFEKLDGVVEAVSGYSGGQEDNPTYESVSAHTGNHRESVQVVYDPDKVSYAKLADFFFKHHDPSDAGGSFGDRGHSYTSAVYYETQEQKEIIDKIVNKLNDSDRFDSPVATSVEELTKFWPAEEYHQDYYIKNSLRYNGYRFASGRDQFIKKTWGDDIDKPLIPEAASLSVEPWASWSKPSDDELRNTLSDIEYKVTQQEGTERAYTHELNDNKEQGIYVDIVSGEPLYSSRDKFDSGTGWPSFTQPIDGHFIIEKTDTKLFIKRTEVRSKYADSHLGHVFNDGPKDKGGLRHCINGAAMRFVPLDKMEGEGYGQWIDQV